MPAETSNIPDDIRRLGPGDHTDRVGNRFPDFGQLSADNEAAELPGDSEAERLAGQAEEVGAELGALAASASGIQEQTDTISPPGEVRENNKHIIHYPEADVIINIDAEPEETGRALAEAFADGIPDQWVDPNLDTHGETYHGEVNGRKLIATVKRRGANKARIEEMRRGGIHDQYRGARASASVSAELSIAPSIKRLMESEDAQALARAAGFKSIHYVEPLLAIIDKKSGVKSVVYDYIEDLKSLWTIAEEQDRKERNQMRQSNQKFLSELIKLFNDAGTIPNDLHLKHLLKDKEGNLFVIDAEEYVAREDS